MSYVPSIVPRTLDATWLQQELRRIAESMEYGDVVLRLFTTATTPSKVNEGEIRVADGVYWDPGAGPGTYIYRNGAWRMIESNWTRNSRSLSFFLGD